MSDEVLGKGECCTNLLQGLATQCACLLQHLAHFTLPDAEEPTFMYACSSRVTLR